MKKIIIFASLLALVSCEKDWKCTIVTTGYGMTTTHQYTFKGTKQEMKEFEQKATNTSDITQTTDCK